MLQSYCIILLFIAEVIIGDEELSWDMEDIHVGDDVVIRPLHERAQAMLVELDGGDIGVVVTRHHDDIGYYLGVYLSNTEGLSNDSEGLLGNSVDSCLLNITVRMFIGVLRGGGGVEGPCLPATPPPTSKIG